MTNKITKNAYRFHDRFFSNIKREHLSKLKDRRNSQMNILRQDKLLTDADQEKWFKLINNDNSQVIFIISELNCKNSNKLIGYCGIVNIDYENSKGEISFLVDSERINNLPLYREDFLSALYVLCCYGFENISLSTLYTETYLFRKHHIEILEEFGFKQGKILKERKLVDGIYWDSIIHSVLKDEWPKIKERTKDEFGK